MSDGIKITHEEDYTTITATRNEIEMVEELLTELNIEILSRYNIGREQVEWILDPLPIGFPYLQMAARPPCVNCAA